MNPVCRRKSSVAPISSEGSERRSSLTKSSYDRRPSAATANLTATGSLSSTASLIREEERKRRKARMTIILRKRSGEEETIKIPIPKSYM